MTYFAEKKWDEYLPYEGPFSGRTSTARLEIADILRTVTRHSPKPKSDGAGRDYSEEAIPERDPAYCLPSGEVNEEATMEALSPETRLELTLRLQQLGMSRGRALAVASL
jgi:hypothetical protein